jgi:hypothetical protein
VHREGGHKVRTGVVRNGHPLWFVLSHPTMDSSTGKTCSHKVYRFRILLRGQVKAFEIKGFSPIRFCDKGARVTPVTSKRPG